MSVGALRLASANAGVIALALLSGSFANAHPGHEVAIERTGELIESHPDAQALHLYRAGLQVLAGHWAAAEASLTNAEALGDPRAAGLQRGLLALGQRRAGAAVHPLTDYLALHPAHPQALLSRARAQQQLSRFESALADYASYFGVVERTHPGDVLAAVEVCRELGRLEQALALIDQHNPSGQAQLTRRAIEIERQIGDMAGALTRMSQLGVLLKHSPSWALEMANLLASDGQNGQARKLLERAAQTLSSQNPTPARRALSYQITNKIGALTPR